MPNWAQDVCNIYGSWVSSDRPQDDEERLSASLDDALADHQEGDVASATRSFLNALTTGDRSTIEEADGQLRAACIDEGWELPEG